MRYMYPVDKEDWTQEMEYRSQWSALAWAAYCALYYISCVQSSLSTVHCISKMELNEHDKM